MPKKSEAFASEAEYLRLARERASREDLTQPELSEIFHELCAEYEKLIEEARFITKISDKLEAKVNAQNEELEQKNKLLSQDVDVAMTEKEKALKKNERLAQAKAESEVSKNKLQLLITILIALLLIVVILFVYIIFFDGHKNL
jgi:uncharacterized membrane protein